MELIEEALVEGRNVELLFTVDKLMSELVAIGGHDNRYITFAPLSSYPRKLVHDMAKRYGLGSQSRPGTTRRGKPKEWCRCCDTVYAYHQVEHKRVVVSWTPSARPPSELIGAIYMRLKGKRSQLDTSHEGAYRYIQRRAPAPVWLVRRKREEEAAAAIGADISSVRPTDSNIGALPPEMLAVVFGFLSRGEDLVCAGLVNSQWHAISLNPALWRRLCGFHLARVNNTHVDVDEAEKDAGHLLEQLENKKRRGKKVDKMMRKVFEEERQDKEEEQQREETDWKACYAKHHWEWRLGTADLRRALKRIHGVSHTHSFLGTNECRRPHF